MTRSKLIFLFVFAVILLMSFHFAIGPDTWWHMSAGRWMVENKAVINQDVFSFTKQATEWRYPGPWIQVVLFLLFRSGGVLMLSTWVTMMVMLAWFVVWYQMEGIPGVKAFLLLLAASSVWFYYVARPFLITFLIFAVFLFLFRKREKEDLKHFWWIYPLMVIWVNSHGGFVAGFLVWGVYFGNSLIKWVEEKYKQEDDQAWQRRSRNDLFTGVLLFLASLLNPSGAGIWRLFFSTISREAEKLHILEWQSPDFHSSSMLPFLILIVLTVIILGYSKKVKLADILLIGGFLMLGLISVRNIFFFSISAAVVLSGYGSELVQEIIRSRKAQRSSGGGMPVGRKTFFYNITALLIIGFSIGWIVTIFSADVISEAGIEANYPVEAVSFIREAELPPNMFNSYNFGGYLTWALPEYPVFIDGRADLYQDDIFFEWNRVAEAEPGWQQTMEERDIGFAILEPKSPLAKLLPCYGWMEVFSDDIAVVFARDEHAPTCHQ